MRSTITERHIGKLVEAINEATRCYIQEGQGEEDDDIRQFERIKNKHGEEVEFVVWLKHMLWFYDMMLHRTSDVRRIALLKRAMKDANEQLAKAYKELGFRPLRL